MIKDDALNYFVVGIVFIITDLFSHINNSVFFVDFLPILKVGGLALLLRSASCEAENNKKSGKPGFHKNL